MCYVETVSVRFRLMASDKNLCRLWSFYVKSVQGERAECRGKEAKVLYRCEQENLCIIFSIMIEMISMTFYVKTKYAFSYVELISY